MSDSVSKWHDMQEDVETGGVPSYSTISHSFDNNLDSIKKEAYTILANYKEDSIFKAVEILQKIQK